MKQYRTYKELFEEAIGFAPFPYQVNFAQASKIPERLSVPTGLGKTATVILGWLWRRRCAETAMRESTPRRLVYCLPMRVLVEQTRDCAVAWLNNLGLLGGKLSDSNAYNPWDGDDESDKIRVHMLMGGEVDRDWDAYPDRDAILIGTQDMLLSRALNRGYAASRFRWPLQFGLLNNDCLWVMDEVQLMGNGLATTAQMQAFRRKLGTLMPTQSIWMSATMHRDWLATVDFDAESDAPSGLEISDEDRVHPSARPRLSATKKLAQADFHSSKDGKREAALALENHDAGSRTLIVVNTVKRAQDIFETLKKSKPNAELVLLHSRFRQPDRDAQLEKLLAPPGEQGTIAVSTQVIEAGVDVSAKLLITDLAPWSSMVQRFGRCNRRGEFNETSDANIIWIAPENLGDEIKMKSAPYEAGELCLAAQRLEGLTAAGPSSLPSETDALKFAHVIRRKDIVELFDTTPDLAGADIDVSRFIRESDEHHLQVFWRDFSERDPSEDESQPRREELCSVPLADLKQRTAWRWDSLEKRWERTDRPSPGLVLMLRADDGGYNAQLGWTGKEKKRVEPFFKQAEVGDANDLDRLSETGEWQSIAEHTDRVVAAMEQLLAAYPTMSEDLKSDVLLAARRHDQGKAHHVFQNAMPEDKPSGIWAKSAGRMSRYERPGFRHELASAVAILQSGLPDLSAYLAAAHHGKVRLSIRSLPHEIPPEDAAVRFARGVHDNDTLPSVDLGGGVVTEPTTLSLSYMALGEDPDTGPSWLARMLDLRDNFGPFKLAFLEAIIRVADWRGSAGEVSK